MPEQSTTDNWKPASPGTVKELGTYLGKAESALRDALKLLHDQQDRSEFFEGKHSESLGKWAAEVTDLADSVRRQV